MKLFSRKLTTKPMKLNDLTQMMNSKSIHTGLSVFMGGLSSFIHKTGKSQAEILDICLSDVEVASCLDDIFGAMSTQNFRIFSPVQKQMDEATLERFYQVIRQHKSVFIDIAMTARLNGYSVAEYVYKVADDGFIYIDKVINKDGELHYYQILPDGTLVYDGDDGKQSFGEDWQTIKFNVLTHKATPSRPMGEMAIMRVYPAVALKAKSMAYASQFITRYAQPYVIGKQRGFNLSDFANTLYGFVGGGAAVVGENDDISIHQLSGDGAAFERIESLANRQIQKLLLGRVKTSELTSGSRAAQETDDNARTDRMASYLSIMAEGIQHAINAMIAVNNAYGAPIQGELIFEFNEQIRVDIERAERDKLYMQMGAFSLTDSYITDILGFEKDHIKPATQQLSLNLSENPQDNLAKIQTALNNAKDFAEFSRLLDRLELSDFDMTSDLIKARMAGLAGVKNSAGENQID